MPIFFFRPGIFFRDVAEWAGATGKSPAEKRKGEA
jgi:hypothetical protein